VRERDSEREKKIVSERERERKCVTESDRERHRMRGREGGGICGFWG
jgi:hypothetical protein